MGFLFEVLDFPEGSRMTDLWNNTWAEPAMGEEIASGHFIHLGDDQHVDVETDFLSSHLPFQRGRLRWSLSRRQTLDVRHAEGAGGPRDQASRRGRSALTSARITRPRHVFQP